MKHEVLVGKDGRRYFVTNATTKLTSAEKKVLAKKKELYYRETASKKLEKLKELAQKVFGMTFTPGK